MKKVCALLIACGLVACGPMPGGTVLDNSSFVTKLSSCHDSYSCKELHAQAVEVLTSNKCDKPATITCSAARSNADQAFEKYSRLVGAEGRSAEEIRRLSEADRQSKIQALKNQQHDKDVMTQQSCVATLELRARAMHEYEALSRVKQDNAEWVTRNCKVKQTDQMVCAQQDGEKICQVVVGTPILNCGSNKRPLKFDGSRLSDTDILENHVGSSVEDEQRLSNDNFGARADQKVCDEADARLKNQ